MQLRNITMVGLASALPTSPLVFPYATQPPRSPSHPPPPPLPSCFNDTSSEANRTLTAEERLAEQVKWAIMDVTVPIVCALGLVGNLLSLVVLTTEKLHRTLTKMEISAHIGLIALAVSDFLFCLLVLIFTQVRSVCKNAGLCTAVLVFGVHKGQCCTLDCRAARSAGKETLASAYVCFSEVESQKRPLVCLLRVNR
ncbi:hypothetical protein RRG08_058276 [Elysia crispata]|uniref:G-protein coupled receptors family 1 profile domain-containing protein n=1 Tax=Elysia crispata TaxID=231223 RepID=A0AAE0YXD4_9GAST|nr:hypothetical protein RRG08_058276 [Elysia crispata]